MIEIREARLEDLEEISALVRQLEEVTTVSTRMEPSSLERVLQSMLGQPETYRTFLALDSGRIVGLLSLLLYKTLLHAGGTALINELVVSEAHRGRGIGRALVQKAIDVSRQTGMDELEVGTEKSNSAALGFYAALGFDSQYVLLGRQL